MLGLYIFIVVIKNLKQWTLMALALGLRKEMICEQNKNTNEETENLKRNLKEITKLKTTVTEMKILLKGSRGRTE